MASVMVMSDCARVNKGLFPELRLSTLPEPENHERRHIIAVAIVFSGAAKALANIFANQPQRNGRRQCACACSIPRRKEETKLKFESKNGTREKNEWATRVFDDSNV